MSGFNPAEHVALMTRVELLLLLRELPHGHVLRPLVEKRLRQLRDSEKRKTRAA